MWRVILCATVYIMWYMVCGTCGTRYLVHGNYCGMCYRVARSRQCGALQHVATCQFSATWLRGECRLTAAPAVGCSHICPWLPWTTAVHNSR